MKSRINMKKFGAIVLAASLSFGMLATSAQETNAAANYQVKKVAYSKEYNGMMERHILRSKENFHRLKMTQTPQRRSIRH